jgi:hypothetical protein
MPRPSVINPVPNRHRGLPVTHFDVCSGPKSSKDFQEACVSPQLTSLKPDLIATINGAGATRDDTR